MSIIGLLVLLVVVGLVLYLVQSLPIDANIKVIIRVVAVLILIVWLLQAFGLLGGSIPQLR